MSAIATIDPGPQYMQALAKANEVRLARAGLKRRTKQSRLTLEFLTGLDCRCVGGTKVARRKGQA